MEDRQVQHIFESNATSAALAPNVACHKCLARESNFSIKRIYIIHIEDLISMEDIKHFSPWFTISWGNRSYFCMYLVWVEGTCFEMEENP